MSHDATDYKNCGGFITVLYPNLRMALYGVTQLISRQLYTRMHGCILLRENKKVEIASYCLF